MALTEDEVLWGAANMLVKRHGARAQVMVAERIGALALQGDALGVAAYKTIAAKVDELLRPHGAA